MRMRGGASYDHSHYRWLWCGGVWTPPRTCIIGCALLVALLICAAACRPRGGLAYVRTAGVLRVAVDPSFPPFESVNAEGELVGLDIDLARTIADQLDVEAHFVVISYDALYDALTSGRADVIVSALYPDPSRSHAFLFSRPYFNAGHVLVVTGESDVTAVGDLAGQPLACVFGTIGHMEILNQTRTMPSSPIVLTVEDPITITRLLHTGEARAVVLDHVSALIAASQDPDLRILDVPVTDEPYVVALRQEDASLKEAIDAALEEMIVDGHLEDLIDRWMVP